MRITKQALASRFKLLADAMGWDITSPAWTPCADGKGAKATVGYVFLSRSSLYGWSISQMANEDGGQYTIKDICTAAEMFAWLNGANYAAWKLKNKKAPT